MIEGLANKDMNVMITISLCRLIELHCRDACILWDNQLT